MEVWLVLWERCVVIVREGGGCNFFYKIREVFFNVICDGYRFRLG